VYITCVQCRDLYDLRETSFSSLCINKPTSRARGGVYSGRVSRLFRKTLFLVVKKSHKRFSCGTLVRRWYTTGCTILLLLSHFKQITLFYISPVVVEEIAKTFVNKQTPRPYIVFNGIGFIRVQRFIVAFKFKDTRPPGTPKCPTPVHRRLFFCKI